MSVSTGRYRILIAFPGYNEIYLYSKDSIYITVKYPPDDPEVAQWDVALLESGKITMRNVKAKLYIGHNGKSGIVATSEPCEWALKRFGEGYMIYVPDKELVIDAGDTVETSGWPAYQAVLRAPRVTGGMNEWSFSSV